VVAELTLENRLLKKSAIGVGEDGAHLAVALCRCMTIPARYRTGDLGYIGVSATDFLSLVRSLSQQPMVHL